MGRIRLPQPGGREDDLQLSIQFHPIMSIESIRLPTDSVSCRAAAANSLETLPATWDRARNSPTQRLLPLDHIALDRINPILESTGTRAARFHQHLTQGYGIEKLKRQVQEVQTLVAESDTVSQFKKLFQKRFPREFDQRELLDE
jgi:hypothetical protein